MKILMNVFKVIINNLFKKSFFKKKVIIYRQLFSIFIKIILNFFKNKLLTIVVLKTLSITRKKDTSSLKSEEMSTLKNEITVLKA